jgi:hypothetical protein
MKLGACSYYHFSFISGIVWIYLDGVGDVDRVFRGKAEVTLQALYSDILALTCMKSSPFHFENLSLY